MKLGSSGSVKNTKCFKSSKGSHSKTKYIHVVSGWIDIKFKDSGKKAHLCGWSQRYSPSMFTGLLLLLAWWWWKTHRPQCVLPVTVLKLSLSKQTQTSAYDTWDISAQCPHASPITALGSLGWCVRAVSYSTGHALLTPQPVPRSDVRRKKPRSCHGSWTPAGMHINILQRDTGERSGVKFYHLVATRAALSFY